MNRRSFLIGCGAGAALAATSKWRLMAAPLQRALAAQTDQVMVVIFLRGGCDGLQLIAPHSDRHYQDARPNSLKVSRKEGIDLGEYQGTGFSLHPNAAPLNDLFTNDDLAIVHSCGLLNGTRSHFDAMDYIERGISKNTSVYNGWMARYLENANPQGRLPAVSASGELAQAFAGYSRASSIQSLPEYNLSELIRDRELIQSMYQNDPLMGSAARQTLDTIQYLQTSLSASEKRALEEGKDGYPDHWAAEELSRSLQSVATLIKMNSGVRMINVDYGGWDTHEHQPEVFARLVKGLSESLMAFYKDICNHHDRVNIVVMTEFGRRLRANRSNGTDHGHGNFMLVLGGNVKGGKHYGNWPGLHPDALDKGVDLAVTTDYRNVLSNVLKHQMGVGEVSKVFPGFDKYNEIGFF